MTGNESASVVLHTTRGVPLVQPLSFNQEGGFYEATITAVEVKFPLKCLLVTPSMSTCPDTAMSSLSFCSFKVASPQDLPVSGPHRCGCHVSQSVNHICFPATQVVLESLRVALQAASNIRIRLGFRVVRVYFWV